ncbi:hypothetical protein PHYC_03448 [Phycisphaerales bacterium]|nr:hypothetical protein PHYC_03448 [Phycisphaerales bacterium]
MSEPAAHPALPELLRLHAGLVRSIIQSESGTLLLRFDSLDDLHQGVMQEAIAAGPAFEWRGQEAFLGWLATITRRHLSARRDYWFACKRNPGAVLRLTRTTFGGGIADQASGPSTFANRREQIVLITKAMAMLLPRDRDVVAWSSAGVDLDQIATWLGVTRDAAEKCRTRAMERLRKAFILLTRQSGTRA